MLYRKRLKELMRVQSRNSRPQSPGRSWYMVEYMRMGMCDSIGLGPPTLEDNRWGERCRQGHWLRRVFHAVARPVRSVHYATQS